MKTYSNVKLMNDLFYHVLHSYMSNKTRKQTNKYLKGALIND